MLDLSNFFLPKGRPPLQALKRTTTESKYKRFLMMNMFNYPFHLNGQMPLILHLLLKGTRTNVSVKINTFNGL
jgi:hypothetical protein